MLPFRFCQIVKRIFLPESTLRCHSACEGHLTPHPCLLLLLAVFCILVFLVSFLDSNASFNLNVPNDFSVMGFSQAVLAHAPLSRSMIFH